MLDAKDFAFFENQNNFDFKGFLVKILGYWKMFVICLIITFTIAYQVNVRKEKIYGIESLINIKEENNPFFTSNTSLVFNWGGTSDKVQTVQTILKSRSHNEKVVKKLDFYIQYLKQGKYHFQDAYGEVPFFVKINASHPQLLGKEISIKFLNQLDYEIKIPFENENITLINYLTGEKNNIKIFEENLIKKCKVGQNLNLPYLEFNLEVISKYNDYVGDEYFIRFDDFNSTVSNYKSIEVDPIDSKGGAILKLSLQGSNKARMVDYLNTTVEMLRKNELDNKNQFAKNTISFIDSTLLSMEKQIKDTEGELENFRRNKNVFEIESDGSDISRRLSDYDVEKDVINRKLSYYSRLESYLKNSRDYSKLPAPAVAGIDDPNIVGNVSKLILLSTERSSMQYTVKNDKAYLDFDNQMESIRKVLLVNIASAKTLIEDDLGDVNRKIYKIESDIKQLPEDQQELVKIKRKYDLNDNIYNTFLQKRSEADIVRAANVSDIQFIDPAKDVGEGLLGPKTSVNYVLAAFLGFLIPLIIAFVLTILDTTIQSNADIEKLTQIPVIGVTGKNSGKTNLAVFEKPKSGIAESFRSIRSSLQFLYRNQKLTGSKTVMITSSISGEGKSFCSANIATVFALSEKKTIIVVLDLRRPKIFQDFNLSNNIGVVNYLIGQNNIEEVTQKTEIPFLDVITSGPIPPNPSELIMGDSMREMLEELKLKYDYIILDTPPVGLVSDALELAQYVDVTLYIVRQNVTRKAMLTLVNDKHKRKELKNVSIILNGFENKAKYGYKYGGYKYDYYMNYNYSDSYYINDKPEGIFTKLKNKFFKA